MPKRTISPEIRKFCLERDNYSCQHPGCTLSKKNGDIVHLHHVLPEQFGGQETPDNLITLCDIHHKGRHIEFHAYYSDSLEIIQKMFRIYRTALSQAPLFVDTECKYSVWNLEGGILSVE